MLMKLMDLNSVSSPNLVQLISSAQPTILNKAPPSGNKQTIKQCRVKVEPEIITIIIIAYFSVELKTGPKIQSVQSIQFFICSHDAEAFCVTYDGGEAPSGCGR